MGIYINGVEMPKSCGHCFMNHICERIPTQKVMFVTKRLKGCPIVQAREPKRGEWIRTGRTNIYGGIEVQCSNCGDKVMVQHLEDEWFCRHCGADMGMKGADDEISCR